MTPKELALYGELARRRLKPFVLLFWNTIEPTPLVDGWYLDAICEHLEALASRKITKLIINLPPRHTKSLLTVFYTAWVWASRPQERFLASSYSLQLSTRDNVKCRRLIESPLYQQLYGVQIAEDQNQKGKYQTSQGGYRLATSVESANLGEGADCIIVDDANDISHVHSPAEREKVLTWFDQVMSTRLNPFGNGCILLVQQRCHEEDLSGHIISHDQDNNWCRLILPYEYDPEHRSTTTIGWTDPRKRKGELLSSAVPDVKERKARMGGLQWSAQYQQRPAPADGAVFKSNWFHLYPTRRGETDYILGERRFSPHVCRRFAAADLAISVKKEADYTVVVVCDVTPDNDLVIVHLVRRRMAGTLLLPTFRTIQQDYHPQYYVVEDVAFQKLLIQQARQEGLTVRSFKPQHDKLTRSLPLQIRMEAGQVWWPETAVWRTDLEMELLSFPGGVHDDMVDALSICADEINRNKGVRVYFSEPAKIQSTQPKITLLHWDDVERLRAEHEKNLQQGTL